MITDIFGVIIVVEVKKMKKKYGLFKVLSLLLFVCILVTYFVNGRQGTTSYLALGDVVLNYLQSFYYFFDTALFILVVGGFYGVLNKIPAYHEMLKRIAMKFKERRLIFVIAVTIIMALVASLTGLDILLFLFVPMIISIILLLGYDKLVALSSTVGSIIVGFIGGIFVTFKDPTSLYSISYTTMDELVGLESSFNNLIPRILLLVLGIGLLIYNMISHIKKVETSSINYDIDNDDTLLVEVKSTTKRGKKEVNNVRVWPLVFTLVLMFIVLVLGYLPWNDLFEVDVFNKFHAWLLELKVGDYLIFNNLISSNLGTYGAFGTWGGFGNYMMAMLTVLFFTVILALGCHIKFLSLGYKMKVDDFIDGFVWGVKMMIPSVMMVMLGYTLLVCVYNHGFVETIITMVSENLGDNPVVHGLIVLVGSVLHVDLYYNVSGVFMPILSSLSETANLSVYSVMLSSLYGLVQLFGPTSVMLVICLTYLEIPYKTWLKYIWRFVVEVLIVILLIIMGIFLWPSFIELLVDIWTSIVGLFA